MKGQEFGRSLVVDGLPKYKVMDLTLCIEGGEQARKCLRLL